MVTPSTIPRVEKRALKVTIGIANHPSIKSLGPPVSATLAPMMTSEVAQAANIAYSGRATLAIPESAILNIAPAISNGTIVQ